MKIFSNFGFVLLVFLGLIAPLGFISCGSDNNIPAGQSPGTTPATAPAGKSAQITIPIGATGRGAAAYGANPLQISAGTTVTWTNQDSHPHTATSNTGIWDSGTLQAGQSFSFNFKNAGSFPYFCTIHGAASMSGVVQVTP